MDNPLFQAICRTGIFMICAQAIVHFRPHESYEKYLKLLVSVMILVQLFLPVASLFAGTGGMKTDALYTSFQEKLRLEMEEATQQAKMADTLLEQMTLEEVRRRMEEQTQVTGGQEEQEDTQDSDEGKETAGSKIPAGGPVTVEVEPVEPILGAQTGGQADGE